MAEDDDVLTTDDNESPVSGYLSIVLTIIGLVMLLLIKILGITSSDETGWSIEFVLYLFISMTFAIAGGFLGFLGLSEDNNKKIFPIIGLIVAAIYVVSLGYVIGKLGQRTKLVSILKSIELQRAQNGLRKQTRSAIS